MISEKLDQAARDLIRRAGLPPNSVILPVSGGANNRAYRVDGNGSSALLKVYFHHPEDTRDRLGAEFSFSAFAWKNGVRALPEPLACDRESRMALYEFVEGRLPVPSDVTPGTVGKFLDFFQEINQHKEHPDAASLPKASEACFTISEHLSCVEERLQRLMNLEESSSIDREAALFVRTELQEAWQRAKGAACSEAARPGMAMSREVPQQNRCISPSDFGFHNAVIERDGGLRFIDFEYAGWDDPAKMVCDFFSQPAVPVPMEHYHSFAEAVAGTLSRPEMQMERMALLLPVYRLKWCCILLNEFRKPGRERRSFAGEANSEERKAAQLHKARETLGRICDSGSEDSSKR
ncbi:MAG: aminoglycoside phosphotransferase family protein [Armatimonadetes bacterium]|nr:aminoglycoside phosphotransferase family protein [Armatimonadota bacterium]